MPKSTSSVNHVNLQRRRLLRGAAGLTGSGLLMPLGINLAAVGNANAQTVSDYRALVCVNLGGGNDHLSTIVPYDPASYNKYSQARGNLAQLRTSLLPIVPTTSQAGKEAALHANLPGMKTLFDAQRLAVVASVGPMIVPVTKANFGSPTVPLPPQLFSHSDQSVYWVSSQGDGGQNGWGGRFGDLLSVNNSNNAFTTLSVFGYSKFLVGKSTSFFTVSEAGAPSSFFDAGSALDAALTRSSVRSNLLEKAYAQVHENLRDNGTILAGAIVPESTFATPPGGGRSSLAQQLLTVARIIACRGAIGAKRQIFYVTLGGFDTHSGQSDRHDALMTELDQALAYFDACMGVLGTRNQVTLFTTSEFGRTLTSNGDGTDHGWASHHLVMGGAVRGKNIYGTLPTLDLAGPDFLDEGNQIPSTAVEQYGATLAKWIGVDNTGIDAIFPNLGNFNQRDLGFMAQ